MMWACLWQRLKDAWAEWNRRHEACEGDALMTRMLWREPKE